MKKVLISLCIIFICLFCIACKTQKTDNYSYLSDEEEKLFYNYVDSERDYYTNYSYYKTPSDFRLCNAIDEIRERKCNMYLIDYTHEEVPLCGYIPNRIYEKICAIDLLDLKAEGSAKDVFNSFVKQIEEYEISLDRDSIIWVTYDSWVKVKSDQFDGYSLFFTINKDKVNIISDALGRVINKEITHYTFNNAMFEYFTHISLSLPLAIEYQETLPAEKIVLDSGKYLIIGEMIDDFTNVYFDDIVNCINWHQYGVEYPLIAMINEDGLLLIRDGFANDPINRNGCLPKSISRIEYTFGEYFSELYKSLIYDNFLLFLQGYTTDWYAYFDYIMFFDKIKQLVIDEEG